MNVFETYIIVFIVSLCTMVIEIIAGRMLAPYVGVSLYTWTSIIGVILAGISLGAYIGGRLADRFPRRRTLGVILLASGIMVLGIVPLVNRFGSHSFHLSLMMSILCLTSIIFLIPGCLLGTVSPVAVKLTLRELHKAGNTVGTIYAVSTCGAIVGTFITGFFLVGAIGTRLIIFAMALLLMLTALLSGGLFRSRKLLVLSLLVLIPAMAVVYKQIYKVLPFADAFVYKESAYYTIRLERTTSSDDENIPIVHMILDRLIHSEVCLTDPLHLEYEYERIYADVMKWRYKKDASFKTLSVGGGGYAFPRYLEVYYPGARIDVVEIDPEVTRVAYGMHGLDKNGTRIVTYNTDGRWFIMGCKEKYDVILIDAFNDLSVPYHLTTREFAEQLRGILSPGGLLMTNIVDNFQKGTFLPSYIRTLQEAFGKKNVHLVSIEPDFEKTKVSTFIVLAANGHIDVEDFGRYVKAQSEDSPASSVVPEVLVRAMVANRRSVIITDDYAPVDNLIAPVFEERLGHHRE